jgi:hypothetical protein
MEELSKVLADSHDQQGRSQSFTLGCVPRSPNHRICAREGLSVIAFLVTTDIGMKLNKLCVNSTSEGIRQTTHQLPAFTCE